MDFYIVMNSGPTSRGPLRSPLDKVTGSREFWHGTSECRPSRIMPRTLYVEVLTPVVYSDG